MTKEHRALRLVLIGRKGAYNLAAVDHLGESQIIRTSNTKFDVIELTFRTADDCSPAVLTDFLAGHAEAFTTWAKSDTRG
jgi:hypothetical protein